jgi:hypothetical protein
MKKPFTRVLFVLFTSALICSILNLASCTSTTPHQLSTSIAPSDGGSISPSGGAFQGKVTLVATPANYYVFNGWGGDISGSIDPVTISMDSDKNVVASFKKITYSLQLSVSPSNSGTLDPNNGNYEAGNQLTITATPAEGYRFDHWGGSATGTANQISVLMDNNKTVTAYFIKQYTLNLSSNPNNGGTITPSGGVYDAGTKVTLTGTQVFPYAFTSWTGTDNDAISPTTVTMDSDKTVTCNFEMLTPGDWITDNETIYNSVVQIPIELNQYEYVEGGITASAIHAYIQDPTGTTIKDLGILGQSNFLITGLVPGRYTIALQSVATYPQNGTGAEVKYRIYKR